SQFIHPLESALLPFPDAEACLAGPGLDDVPDADLVCREEIVAVLRFQIGIRTKQLVLQAGSGSGTPDIVTSNDDIQAREKNLRRLHMQDPEQDGDQMSGENKWIEDVDNVPGDPPSIEGGKSLGTVCVE